MDRAESWIVFIPVVAIVGGIVLAVVNTVMRSRLRELEIRERIAMIERGLVPAPETDPRGFERAMERLDDSAARPVRRGRPAARYRRAGITLMGIGAGLLIMLYPSFRVGGFLLAFGLAFLISSLFESDAGEPATPTPRGSSSSKD